MEHKAWGWRKKASSEKTVFAAGRDVSPLRKPGEVRKNPADKGVGAERSVKTLNEKLASVLLECRVSEEPEPEGADVIEENVGGDSHLQVEEEKEAMKARRAVVREEEQEKKINDAVTKASKLEERYAELSKELADLSGENYKMATALLVKEKLVEDLRRRTSQSEAEFGALMARLDTTEKENAFLKYEFHLLDKDLRIRCEETEYYRRTAEAFQKQHLDDMRKIVTLEQECRKLSQPARKRVNCPSGLGGIPAKGRNQTEARRRKSNPSKDLIVRDSAVESSPEILVERLRVLEEDNEALKGALSRRIPELQFSDEVARRNRTARKISLSSDLDTGSEDAVSSSGSWANALISELEHFKTGRLKDLQNRKVSDISLMDDFVEMEKLAIVSVDKPCRDGPASGKPFDWLQVVLSAMLEQSNVSKRSLGELLEDIKITLGFVNSPAKPEAKKSPVPQESGDRNNWCCLGESIRKIVKLIREINPESVASSDYFIRVFQWRNSELNAVLQRFVQTCEGVLNGRSDLERFSEEVALTLGWILNNYVTPKEAANTRAKIKKHFGLNETETENDRKPIFPDGKSDPAPSQDQPLGWPLLTSGDDRLALVPVDNTPCTTEDENGRLKNELEIVVSAKLDTEAKLHLATEESKGLVERLRDSEQRIGSLQAELDKIENEKLNNDDLETQLSIAKCNLNEVCKKVSSLEVELEEKRNCCEELEATCLELQLQLESDLMKEAPNYKTSQEEKQSETGWPITTSSTKLLECQETIINLRKQLRVLSTRRKAGILDVFSSNNSETVAKKDENLHLSKRSSLLDRMLAEDGAKPELPSPRKAKAMEGCLAIGECRSSSFKVAGNAGGPLTIVPVKKKGIGFDLLRKLLIRRKKGNGQKTRVSGKV